VIVGKAQTTSNSAEKIQTGAEIVVEGKPSHELRRGNRPVVAEVGVIKIRFDAGDDLSNLVIVTDLAATSEAISIECAPPSILAMLGAACPSVCTSSSPVQFSHCKLNRPEGGSGLRGRRMEVQ
jgi:hypothetical protein